MPVDEYGINYRLTSNLGLPFNELQGSGECDMANDGSSGVRLFHTPWRSIVGFCTEALGGVTLIGGRFLRVPPARHPMFTFMYATGCKFKGLGRIKKDNQNRPFYEKGAMVTVTYKTPTFDQPDEVASGDGQEVQLITETMDFSAQLLTIPGIGYYYQPTASGTSTKFIDADVAILVGQVEIAYARHYVPYLPRQTISDYSGTVNHATFAGRAAETLLFLGAQARRVVTVQGSKAWELTYKFLERTAKTRTNLTVGSDIRNAGIPAGWNRDYIGVLQGVEVNDWVRIKTISGGRSKYELADFNGLFDPAAA